MRKKTHKIILTILILYAALILFFLFFSFGRLDTSVSDHDYGFNLIPSLIHLRFPTITNFEHFQLFFFNLGNFAGFIPFGILVPILYRCNFIRFISLFVLIILIVETVQMLTYFGSFDINDAIVNSLGASVGFVAYKIGFRSTNIWKRLVVTTMSVVILSIAVIGFSELMNKSFTKIEGPIIALNELDSNSDAPIDKDLQSFKIGHEKIEPKINLYGSEGDHIKTFSYGFGGKDIVLSLNHGISNNASDYEDWAIISVDGIEVETYSNKDHGSSEINLDKVNELTITTKGNVKLWDVTYKEMKYWWN